MSSGSDTDLAFPSFPSPPSITPELSALIAMLRDGGVIEAFTEEVVAGLTDQFAPQFGDAEAARSLSELAHASVRALTAVATGASRAYEVPPEALRTARLLARRSMTVEEVMGVFGVARQSALSHVARASQVVAVPPAQQIDLVVDAGRLLLWLADASQATIVSELTREREALSRGTHARRREVVRAILAGQSTDADRAGEQLGYNLRHWHVALLCWNDVPDDTTDTSLREVIRRCASALAGSALVVEQRSHELEAWIATERRPDTSVLADVLGLGPDIRLVVGQPSPGMPGFCQSHEQAEAVRRLAPALRAPQRLLRYDDLDVLALSAREPTLLRAFVTTVLGALAAEDAATERLRESLRVYFNENLRIATAAERLSVHPNTLRYRIQQAEELLGHSVNDDRFRVEFAVRVADRITL